MTDYPPTGSLDLTLLTPEERYALESFGRAANDVFRFWCPHRGHEFRATLFRGSAPDSAELIPETPFRSLALAVRLVFQPSEKGAFNNVAGILRTRAPSAFEGDLAAITSHWENALTGRGNLVYSTTERSFNPREVFETWLYASAFHQDEKKQPDLETLRSFEPSASLTLQLVVCQLAIATVNLDALVRYLLGQPTRDLANHAEQDTAFGLL